MEDNSKVEERSSMSVVTNSINNLNNYLAAAESELRAKASEWGVAYDNINATIRRLPF